MRETWVPSLDWEDPLKKGMATHSSILAWRIPWTEEPGRLQSMVLQRVGPNWMTNTFTLELYVCPYRWTVLASSLQEPSRGTSEEPGSLRPPQMHLRVFWVKLPRNLAHHLTLAHPHQCIVWGLHQRDFQTDTSKHIPNSSWESLGLQGDPTSPS